MRKWLAILLLITFLLSYGCQKKQLIDERNIVRIVVSQNNPDSSVIKTLTDSLNIRKIIHDINSAKIDPAVFKSKIILKITYTNNKALNVLINENRILINGISYKANRPISDMLK